MRFPGMTLVMALAPAVWAIPINGSLPNGTVGAQYSATLSADVGGNAVWSATGLPAGITITSNGASATISGVPTQAGVFKPTVTVSENEVNGSQTYTVTISPAPLAFVTQGALATAIVGQAYSFQIQATGGAQPYQFSSQDMPPGLQITIGGFVIGTPTTSGNFTFEAEVTDQENDPPAIAEFSIAVTPALTFLTPSALPSGTAGSPYSAAISVSGGTAPYMFAITNTPPPGVFIDPNKGIMSGTPTSIGTYTFTVQVTDSLNFSASMNYAVTFTAATPLLQATPLSLTFTAIQGGSTPLPQAISILSTNSTTVSYTTSIDAGAQGSAAPPWISVSPSSGVTPANLLVSVNPSLLTGTTGTAVIQISVAQNTTQAAININVTLNLPAITPNAPIQATPSPVQFEALFSTPGKLVQTLTISDVASGTQPFTLSVRPGAPWLSLSAGSGQAAPNTPALIQMTADTTGLAVGLYNGEIEIQSGEAFEIVPVTLFVAGSGPVLGVGSSGVRFAARQGQGSSRPVSIPILNLGDASSTVKWSATLASGSNWLTLSATQGTAMVTQPGNLTLLPAAQDTDLPAGPQYALVEVSDANSQNSPQYISVVYDNQPFSSMPVPDPSTAGLFFTSKSGSQQLILYASSVTQIPFQVSATTTDGASWLSVTPASGVVSTSSPGLLTVSVAPLPAPGIYTGGINIGVGGTLVVVNVTLVVLPSSAFVPAEGVGPRATTGGCTPSKLALTETGLVNNFSIPAGWPATLIAQLNDDCGNPVNGGALTASFSNGDPPLALRGDESSNTYSATWQPGTIFPEMAVTLRASAAPLAGVTALLTGSVNANSQSPPSLLADGTLNIFFNVTTADFVGTGLAPGTVAQVYGTGLGPSLLGASNVPLPTTIDGTFLLVGQYQAPLFFISQTVMAAQIPFELAANQRYPAVASVNGALSLPITVTVVPVQPGIAVNADLTVQAQHLDYSLVTESSPAMPGETITVYLAAMGATNPPVPSGAATPGLAPVSLQPTVTLNSQQVTVVYAGLTPTGIGLYQINFTVPTDAPSGSLPLVVTQNGVASNVAMVPVRGQ